MSERPSGVAVWMQAARVKSFAISSMGVLCGTAVALHDGFFSWRFLIAWLGSVAIQAGTNLTNISYNYKGAGSGPGITTDTRSSSAVVHEGWLTAPEVRRAGLLCFAAGAVCGLALVWLCGSAILWLGVPSVIAGYSYAGPPLRLGRWGLGVATVFAFMGPVMVGGAYYVAALHFAADAFAASLAIGLLAAGIMHVNDIRDFAGDVRHGKKTMATLLGREGASGLLACMDWGAYVVVGASVASGLLPGTTLVVLLTLPRAVGQVRMVYRENTPDALHEAWLRGVKLHTEFGILLIAGLIAAAVFKL